ncbi:MAG: leucine-rich repeat domain-containing protein [Treponema sp.]|jgi:hypothetical protein|nr:leucine-rich repeat domain-containing protein [Treponema sp.]
MRKNGFSTVRRLLGCALLFGAALAACGNSKPNPAEDFGAEGGEGAGTISGYSGKRKNVVIPAEIDGEPVMAVEAYAFADNADITSVVIPEGVTSIGDFAFANCTALKSVTLPASLKIIGDGAFLHCARLAAAANLPAALDGEGSSVLERLGDFAFGGCVKLDSKTRAALAKLGVTDFELGKPNVPFTVIDGIIGNAESRGSINGTARYNPNLPLNVPFGGFMGIPRIVARNLFSQYALTRGEHTQARLVSASINGGLFSGIIELSNEDGNRMELLLVLLSGADDYNYLLYTRLSSTGTGVMITGSWDEIPDLNRMDYSTGQKIGEALGKLVLPITEQGFYQVRRLADKTNPGVLSPAALANE